MRVCRLRSRAGGGAVMDAGHVAFALWSGADPAAIDATPAIETTPAIAAPPVIDASPAIETPPVIEAPAVTVAPTPLPPASGAGTSALPDLLSRIQIHGFVSQGFLKTTANDYLVDSSVGSFEF